jgi:twinfilin-like protein
LAIELEAETVILKDMCPCSVDQLPGKVPNEEARYHLFRFKHSHEGDYLESVVFIYSMPGYTVPIKERMMYSSCKNAVVEMIGGLGVSVEKSLEVDTGSELTEEYLQGEIQPVKSLNKPKFAKPKGPSRAGGKRITKIPVNNGGPKAEEENEGPKEEGGVDSTS